MSIKKNVISARSIMSEARDKLTDSIICLPDYQGMFGDVEHSINCAEQAIKRIQCAIKTMKKIRREGCV